MSANGEPQVLFTVATLCFMGLGMTVFIAAALVEHYTGRPNFLTRWLWRQ